MGVMTGCDASLAPAQPEPLRGLSEQTFTTSRTAIRPSSTSFSIAWSKSLQPRHPAWNVGKSCVRSCFSTGICGA